MNYKKMALVLFLVSTMSIQYTSAQESLASLQADKIEKKSKIDRLELYLKIAANDFVDLKEISLQFWNGNEQSHTNFIDTLSKIAREGKDIIPLIKAEPRYKEDMHFAAFRLTMKDLNILELIDEFEKLSQEIVQINYKISNLNK